MSNPVARRRGICLSMIVRNEAHTVREALDAVAPYISSWVIVDTGSEDGTPDMVRDHMAGLGIPGELCERPWRNFGHNRTEALTLAQGHGDYIWVMDAGDIIVGTPNFTALTADIYTLRRRLGADICWRAGLFRDGVRVRYEGVVHEYPAWDDSCVAVRLDGDYHIEFHCLGTRSQDPRKLARDRDLLLAEIERNPDDARSVFYLAQTYFELRDFVNARNWYARRVEMGGFEEEVYYAMYQIAVSIWELGASWPEIQDAALRAWEFRPTRAEPLHAIAQQCRADQRYELGYRLAKFAGEIPFPEQDTLYVRSPVYAWRITDEQAVCASAIGKQEEAFTLSRGLLARPDIPDQERRRIAANRDVSVPTMIEAALSYPEPALVQRLVAFSGVHRQRGRQQAEVAVSLVVGPDLESAEQTLNSFLRCCTDVARVGRFLAVDAGLSGEDRAMLRERYGFLEFGHYGPLEEIRGPGAQLAHIRAQVDARFWLHLGQGWRFFAPVNLITRLTAVLKAEPQVFQVGINFMDAMKLIGVCAPEAAVRRTPDAGRYVLADAVATGPAMFDTEKLDQAGGLDATVPEPIAELERRAAGAGLCTASLDEVLCIAAVHQVQQPDIAGTGRRESTSADITAGGMNALLPRITGIVVDKWKVIYVITPKAMCTSMLWLMAELQDEDIAGDVAHSQAAEVSRGLVVHDPAMWRSTRHLDLLPADAIEQITSDDGWFRFCLTRHPVDRLWSAWQSKLLLREPTPAAAYGAARWFPRAPRELPEGAAALDAIAEDFESFVAALAQDSQLLTADPHWAPQSYLLRPEVFPYSEIGRVEAAAVTLGRLERHLKAQGWRGTFELKWRNATLLPRAVIRDPTLLRLIEEIYADDMSAFGYAPADMGHQPSADASAVAVKALIELVDRHERISDLQRMLAPGYYPGSPEWWAASGRSAT